MPLALLLSAVTGRALISNYVPYVIGANVVFDFFPANPTSWFIGTYIHVIVLWAVVLRRVRLSAGLLLLTCLGEILVRAILMQTAGLFVAYMLFTNWATVFLLGCAAARRPRQQLHMSPAEAGAATLVLAGCLVAWVTFGARLPFEPTFPFMRLNLGSPMAAALIVSAMITATYTGITLVVVAIVRALPAPRAVRFFARNTLIIFLAHMPVYYALAPWLMAQGVSHPLRGVLLVAICLPGLAFVSEAIHKLTRPRELREWLFSRAVAESFSSPR